MSETVETASDPLFRRGKCLSCIGGNCQSITALSPRGAAGDFVPRTGLRQVIEGGLSPFSEGGVPLDSP